MMLKLDKYLVVFLQRMQNSMVCASKTKICWCPFENLSLNLKFSRILVNFFQMCDTYL